MEQGSIVLTGQTNWNPHNTGPVAHNSNFGGVIVVQFKLMISFKAPGQKLNPITKLNLQSQ